MNENKLYFTWEDFSTYLIEDGLGNKIRIDKENLPSIANILATAATTPPVWPVRLTLFERITGKYWGNV